MDSQNIMRTGNRKLKTAHDGYKLLLTVVLIATSLSSHSRVFHLHFYDDSFNRKILKEAEISLIYNGKSINVSKLDDSTFYVEDSLLSASPSYDSLLNAEYIDIGMRCKKQCYTFKIWNVLNKVDDVEIQFTKNKLNRKDLTVLLSTDAFGLSPPVFRKDC